jgi:sugar phosphate isomerase/epimerase
MKTISRRQFLGKSAATVAVAAYLCTGTSRLQADPLKLPIGCQLYPVGKMVEQDFAGTLKQIAAIGYKTIELCSPPSYMTSGFAPLAKMKAAEVRKTIEAAGLRCESCHYQFQELKDSLDERVAYAKELGLKQMIVAMFGLPENATLADWAKAAGELNKLGERTKAAGIQLGFHNHHFEFKEIDGVLIYDKLMSELDPKFVKMQFQVAVISLGYQAATYLTKYPGRFISLHLADWSATEKKPVPVGAGVVNWEKLFAAAKIGSIQNYFVEMNLDAMKASYPFLHNLKA